MNNTSINEAWVIRYFSDDATPEERMAVEKWIKESAENQQLAEQLYFIKYAGDTVHFIRSIDTRTDLEKVWKKIRKRGQRLMTVWMQRAAFIAWLCVIPTLIYLLVRDNDHGLTGMMMNVPEGSITSATLPDGSKVWLNAGSHLSYGNGYGISDRRMQLTGEAFFEVKTNPHLPFEVEADGFVVRARGTQFNVKAYPDEHTVTAILTEGEIEIISPAQGQKKTILQPGQKAVYNKQDIISKTETPQPTEKQTADHKKPERPLTVQPVDNTEVYTSWKDQRWLIEGATLGELTPDLQRRYAVKVAFDNDALKTYKFRGEIQNLTVEQVARVFQLTAPMNYRMSNDTLYFTIDLKRKKEFDQFIKQR